MANTWKNMIKIKKNNFYGYQVLQNLPEGSEWR